MKNISGSVAVNDFVRRQTKDSGKTYAKGLTHKEIANHAQDQLTDGNYKMGYRDGVVVVQVSEELIHHFICPFVRVTEKTNLKATVVRRRPEEEPYIQLRALTGTALKTGSVD